MNNNQFAIFLMSQDSNTLRRHFPYRHIEQETNQIPYENQIHSIVNKEGKILTNAAQIQIQNCYLNSVIQQSNNVIEMIVFNDSNQNRKFYRIKHIKGIQKQYQLYFEVIINKRNSFFKQKKQQRNNFETKINYQIKFNQNNQKIHTIFTKHFKCFSLQHVINESMAQLSTTTDSKSIQQLAPKLFDLMIKLSDCQIIPTSSAVLVDGQELIIDFMTVDQIFLLILGQKIQKYRFIKLFPYLDSQIFSRSKFKRINFHVLQRAIAVILVQYLFQSPINLLVKQIFDLQQIGEQYAKTFLCKSKDKWRKFLNIQRHQQKLLQCSTVINIKKFVEVILIEEKKLSWFEAKQILFRTAMAKQNNQRAGNQRQMKLIKILIALDVQLIPRFERQTLQRNGFIRANHEHDDRLSNQIKINSENNSNKQQQEQFIFNILNSITIQEMLASGNIYNIIKLNDKFQLTTTIWKKLAHLFSKITIQNFEQVNKYDNYTYLQAYQDFINLSKDMLMLNKKQGNKRIKIVSSQQTTLSQWARALKL